MTKRKSLLSSIANTAADYRKGELAAPTPDHVDRWISQFEKDVQLDLLREIDHVLKRTYLSRQTVEAFLRSTLRSTKIAGDDPRAFWDRTYFLKIQQSGNSQKEMLDIVDRLLEAEYGLRMARCGKTGGDYVYVDDALFSGSRVGNDLEAWIRGKAPAKAKVHIVVAAVHTGGHYLLEKRLERVLGEAGKSIQRMYWRIATVENRKFHRNDSDVLWPTALPPDTPTREYLAQPHKFPLVLREPGGSASIFSSEQGRQLLERELLVAGVRIRGFSQNPKDILRPLGFSPFGAGFGSMIVTYRNCPNNCPLALWWGDPNAVSGPFNWYPLFPRKTYAQAIDLDVVDF